jgi:WD40 domain-containing protein
MSCPWCSRSLAASRQSSSWLARSSVPSSYGRSQWATDVRSKQGARRGGRGERGLECAPRPATTRRPECSSSGADFVVSGGVDIGSDKIPRGAVRVLDVTTGRMRALPYEGPAVGVAVSADGRTVATGGKDAIIRLWRMTDAGNPRATPILLKGHENTIEQLMFSPADPSVLVSAGDDGRISLASRRGCQNELPHATEQEAGRANLRPCRESGRAGCRRRYRWQRAAFSALEARRAVQRTDGEAIIVARAAGVRHYHGWSLVRSRRIRPGHGVQPGGDPSRVHRPRWIDSHMGSQDRRVLARRARAGNGWRDDGRH